MRYKFYSADTVLNRWTDEETGEKYVLIRIKMFDRKKDALAWLAHTKRPCRITGGQDSDVVYTRKWGKWGKDERILYVSFADYY